LNPISAFFRDVAGFAAFVVRRWGEDRCPQIAGSLTFSTLLALVPLITVVIAVLSALPYFEGAMVQFKIFLLMNLVPEIAGKIITVHLTQFAEAAGRLTTVSLAALFAMAIAMLLTVDHSLSVIWRVDRRRPVWLSLAGYLTILLLGPSLMGLSLWATSWLVAASLDHVAMPSGVESLMLRLVPVTVSAFAFFLLYRVIPNRHVPARHALAGGILAALVFEVMKSVFASYIRSVPTYRVVYGAFASIPIFLLWLYLSWLVVLLGAEFTASLAYWKGRLWRREDSPEGYRRAAFELGRVLACAGTEPVSLERLRESVDMPHDQLEDLLRHLEETGAVRRSRKGWALAGPGERAPS
jgi:membrane protein